MLKFGRRAPIRPGQSTEHERAWQVAQANFSMLSATVIESPRNASAGDFQAGLPRAKGLLVMPRRCAARYVSQVGRSIRMYNELACYE